MTSDLQAINRNPRAITLLLNDRCPLRCAHCTVGYSNDKVGSDNKMSGEQVKSLIANLDPRVYDIVLLAGGEPSLVPHLISAGTSACRSVGLRSALITAPVWARTAERAAQFLGKIERPDVLVLSIDRYHLEFLDWSHYEFAVNAALKRQLSTTMHVAFANEADRAEMELRLIPFALMGVGRSFMPVLPTGNALTLDYTAGRATRVSSYEDVDLIPRSCRIGNPVVLTDLRMHACCWSVTAPESPLQFSDGATDGADLRAMEDDPTFQAFLRHGIIDAMSPKQKRKVVERVRGKEYVNECHLCMDLLRDRTWSSWFKTASTDLDENLAAGE